MQLSAEQAAALRGLGVNPATIAWEGRPPAPEPSPPPRRLLVVDDLSEADWEALGAARVLPPPPSQADAMSDRAFIAAVVAVLRAGAAWTALPHHVSPEAVRRKFARWAHAGVWQRLAASHAPVSADLRRRLEAASMRAQRLSQR